MTYLLYFILALASLFLTPMVDEGWLQRTQDLAFLLPGLLLVPHGLSWLGRRLLLRGRLRIAGGCEWLLRFSPVLLQPVAFLGLGGFGLMQRLWPESLGPLGVETLEDWSELALGLALVPYFLIQLLVIDARARLFGSGVWVRRSRSFQLRMFLSMLVPFLLIGMVSTAFGWNEVWSVRIEEVGLLGGVLGVLLMWLAMWVLPRLLSWVWSTQSLPQGVLRERMEQLAARAGLRFKDLLLWRTEGLMPNAMIVGFSPGTRRVLMTDALMELLSEEELEAVFAHEMGHAKGHHGLLLGAFALGALISTQLVIESLTPWIVERSGMQSDWVASLLLLAALGLWARSFGAYSRHLEMDADLESLRATGNLPAIVNTLMKVTTPHNARRASWRHPSTARRVAFLLSVGEDARLGERLKARLGWMRRSILLLFFVAVAYRTWGAAEDWDRDWLVSDLRLGNYQAAQARLERGSDTSEALGALVTTAAQLRTDQRDADALLAQGLESLEAGDVQRALQLTELAYLRGRRDLGQLLDGLDRALEGEPPGDTALPQSWQAALDRALLKRSSEALGSGQ